MGADLRFVARASRYGSTTRSKDLPTSSSVIVCTLPDGHVTSTLWRSGDLRVASQCIRACTPWSALAHLQLLLSPEDSQQPAPFKGESLGRTYDGIVTAANRFAKNRRSGSEHGQRSASR